jgi:hypothetical protein
MDQILAALNGGWQVLVVGILLGAGLPTMFAFGIRALAWGAGGEAEVHAEGVLLKPNVWGRVIAYTMFTVVILSVLLGISYIVAHGLGWTVTFNGILPVFTPK